MMKKIALLGLLLSAHVMDCSLMARIMPKIKLGAFSALLTLGIGQNKITPAVCEPKEKPKADGEDVVSSYADALVKYPFTTRLLMHRYRHACKKYTKISGEPAGGFYSKTSPTGYRRIYRDYWKAEWIHTSSVILHTGDSDYLVAEIDGTETTPKKVADKLTRIFNDAPKATGDLDRYTNCIRRAEMIQCTSRHVPESLKRIVQAEYQKQTGDYLQRDVWDKADKGVKEYSSPAPQPNYEEYRVVY